MTYLKYITEELPKFKEQDTLDIVIEEKLDTLSDIVKCRMVEEKTNFDSRDLDQIKKLIDYLKDGGDFDITKAFTNFNWGEK